MPLFVRWMACIMTVKNNFNPPPKRGGFYNHLYLPITNENNLIIMKLHKEKVSSDEI